MKLQNDLREFIELLNSHEVEYLIVGGHAVAFHGHPRYTGDIDFFVRPSKKNASRVLSALRDFGFDSIGDLRGTLTATDKVIQFGRPPNRIDILTSISGVSFAVAWETAVNGDIDGLPVRYIGLDALLENKKASGRPKDLADLDELSRE